MTKSITTNSFAVDLEIKAYATVSVEAKDIEEAREKIGAMDWRDLELGEIFDWEIKGFAK